MLNKQDPSEIIIIFLGKKRYYILLYNIEIDRIKE